MYNLSIIRLVELFLNRFSRLQISNLLRTAETTRSKPVTHSKQRPTPPVSFHFFSSPPRRANNNDSSPRPSGHTAAMRRTRITVHVDRPITVIARDEIKKRVGYRDSSKPSASPRLFSGEVDGNGGGAVGKAVGSGTG